MAAKILHWRFRRVTEADARRWIEAAGFHYRGAHTGGFAGVAFIDDDDSEPPTVFDRSAADWWFITGQHRADGAWRSPSPPPAIAAECGWCDIDGAEWTEAVARQGVRIGFDPYDWQAYYRTTHWEWINANWPKTGRCAFCAHEGRTEFHHRTYADVGMERRDQLTELCRDCHRRWHRRYGDGDQRVAA